MTLWRSYAASMDEEEPQIEQRHNGYLIELRGELTAMAAHEAGHFCAASRRLNPREVAIWLSCLPGDHGDVYLRHDGYCRELREEGYDFATMARTEVPNLPLEPGDFVFSRGIKHASAIVASAGPAAEWKYRAVNNLPQALKKHLGLRSAQTGKDLPTSNATLPGSIVAFS